MSNSILDPDYASEGKVFIPPPESLIETKVVGPEVRSDSCTTTILMDSIWWASGMTKVPQNISDVIVNRLQEFPHVKAILMGRSGDVYHVWTMIDEWTPSGRRAVYGAQKELLKKLKGFDLDFYVVALDEGTNPKDLVSDIPVVFPRAGLGC
jgi:hypothetical protein